MREELYGAAADLLDWYDRHARALPWRVGPDARRDGLRPDPYHVWLSEIMLQQTTVAAVTGYFERFVTRWPTVQNLAASDDEEVMKAWAGLGYYARARNLLKCARVVSDELDGVFPCEEAGLLKLPGIGPYTAAAIAAIAFDRPAVVMDGNVERVMARLWRVEEPLPGSKPVLKAHAASLTPDQRPGDYAQAVMDLGATVCTPRNPACGICPWMERCEARATGDAARFPVKAPKVAKPVRQGMCFVARSPDGAVLLERRPDRGLLGGTLGWPGGDWTEAPVTADPPVAADWQEVGEVRHTFTHFHLRLSVMFADDVQTAPVVGRWRRDVSAGDLPTVMAKAWRLALFGG